MMSATYQDACKNLYILSLLWQVDEVVLLNLIFDLFLNVNLYLLPQFNNFEVIISRDDEVLALSNNKMRSGKR